VKEKRTKDQVVWPYEKDDSRDLARQTVSLANANMWREMMFERLCIHHLFTGKSGCHSVKLLSHSMIPWTITVWKECLNGNTTFVAL